MLNSADVLSAIGCADEADLRTAARTRELRNSAVESATKALSCDDPLKDLPKQLQSLLSSNFLHQYQKPTYRDGAGEISSIYSDGSTNSGLDSEAWGPQSEEERTLCSNLNKQLYSSKKVSFSPQGSRFDAEEALSIKCLHLNAMRSEFRRIIAIRSCYSRQSHEQNSPQAKERHTLSRNSGFTQVNCGAQIYHDELEEQASDNGLAERNPNLLNVEMKQTPRSSSTPRTISSFCGVSPSLQRRMSNAEAVTPGRCASSPQKFTSKPQAAGSNRPKYGTNGGRQYSTPRSEAERSVDRLPSRSTPATPSKARASVSESAVLPSTLSKTLTACAAAEKKRTDSAREALLLEMALHDKIYSDSSISKA